ncbi:MAG TPA: 16S rRNA (cytosine(1402)-N(4))-methyltransferase RsmH [Bacteroidales bacterium]|nr:16S rRNA (cytosine(1402)-N(4))-methyltransferase RsmH [Bacteroidales bacterium]HRZ75939.1 16S rRNA (cytosine(1402)-N(4))-methyltransferase RsmH [Bacteroidales bacterium]
MYHKPALLNETLGLLSVRPGGTYVDLTLGGGGHSRGILEQLGEGRLLAFDQDEEARANVPGDPRVTFIPENFRFFSNFLKYHKAYPVDGILADLGVSSHQIDAPERGFSTRFDGPLDMRMNARWGQTAAEFIAGATHPELARVFREYGEIPNAGRLASAIVHARTEQAVDTTTRLRGIAQPLAPRGKENQYYARVFQSLRIHVNAELEALEAMLHQLPQALRSGGRVAIISWHSLEDRMVKNFFRSGSPDGTLQKDFYGHVLTPFQPVTRKAVEAGSAEVDDNPRSRSARLRVAERNEMQYHG